MSSKVTVVESPPSSEMSREPSVSPGSRVPSPSVSRRNSTVCVPLRSPVFLMSADTSIESPCVAVGGASRFETWKLAGSSGAVIVIWVVTLSSGVAIPWVSVSVGSELVSRPVKSTVVDSPARRLIFCMATALSSSIDPSPSASTRNSTALVADWSPVLRTSTETSMSSPWVALSGARKLETWKFTGVVGWTMISTVSVSTPPLPSLTSTSNVSVVEVSTPRVVTDGVAVLASRSGTDGPPV